MTAPSSHDTRPEGTFGIISAHTLEIWGHNTCNISTHDMSNRGGEKK